MKTIMCICGNGSGSSFLLEMNVKKVLKQKGYMNIEVDHTSLTDISKDIADLIICANDLYEDCKQYGETIGVNNIMDLNELNEKLNTYFPERT